jgi:hypothetical protein
VVSFDHGNDSFVKKSIDSGSHVAQMSIKVGICAEKLVASLDIMSSDTLSNMSSSAEEHIFLKNSLDNGLFFRFSFV